GGRPRPRAASPRGRAPARARDSSGRAAARTATGTTRAPPRTRAEARPGSPRGGATRPGSGGAGSEAEVLQETLLLLAERRLDLEVLLEPAPVQLVPQELVELEQPGRVRERDGDPDRLALAGLEPHGVDRLGGHRVDRERAGRERDARAPRGDVERIRDADHARLEGERLAAGAVRDDGV